MIYNDNVQAPFNIGPPDGPLPIFNKYLVLITQLAPISKKIKKTWNQRADFDLIQKKNEKSTDKSAIINEATYKTTKLVNEKTSKRDPKTVEIQEKDNMIKSQRAEIARLTKENQILRLKLNENNKIPANNTEDKIFRYLDRFQEETVRDMQNNLNKETEELFSRLSPKHESPKNDSRYDIESSNSYKKMRPYNSFISSGNLSLDESFNYSKQSDD